MFGGFHGVRGRIAIPLVLLGCLAGGANAASIPSVTVLTPPVTTGVGTPLRVAFDSKGSLWVSDPRMGGVSKFDGQGKLIGILKTQAPPNGIAFDDRGNLLVSQGDSVAVYDESGSETARLGSGVGQFKKAGGIVVDAAGFIYVADSIDNNVKIFTAGGQFAQAIGSKGTGAGEFSMPTGLAYDRYSNEIAVADTRNGRVQFFSAAGNHDFVRTIGSVGTKPLQFRSPVGLTFEYGANGRPARLYVVDTSLNNLQVIDPAGKGSFLAYIGTNGFSNGQLMVPADAAFDHASHRLVVANGSGQLTMYGIDSGNNLSNSPSTTFQINPIPNLTKTDEITISGTVESNATVTVTANTAAVIGPVVFTSANSWKSSISKLAAGENELVITASTAERAVGKHAVSVTYAP